MCFLVLLNVVCGGRDNNALVVVWSMNGTRCVSRDVTLHRLCAFSWESLTLYLSTAVCIRQGKECLRVIQCCTHNSLFLPSPYFAHGPGAPGDSVLIHGSALCRQLKSCLRDWSISRMKPCKQDNHKVQRNRRWQRPHNVSSSYLEACTYPVNRSHRHAHFDVHWSAIGMDNLAIHVQDVLRVRRTRE